MMIQDTLQKQALELCKANFRIWLQLSTAYPLIYTNCIFWNYSFRSNETNLGYLTAYFKDICFPRIFRKQTLKFWLFWHWYQTNSKRNKMLYLTWNSPKFLLLFRKNFYPWQTRIYILLQGDSDVIVQEVHLHIWSSRPRILLLIWCPPQLYYIVIDLNEFIFLHC